MRFSVTSFLAVAGSAAVVESSSSNTANDDRDTQQQQQRRAVLQSFLNKNNRKKPLLHQQQIHSLQNIHHMNLLKNGDALVPCVPPTEDAFLDTQELVGVLSCGEDEYCAESDISHLGGFCQPKQLDDGMRLPSNNGNDRRRQLQYCFDASAYCSGEEQDLEYCEDYGQVLPTCDCGSFDGTTGTGFVSCRVPNYCIEMRPAIGFAPCEPTCYDAIQNTDYGVSSKSTVICSIFTEPYTQTLCRGYAQTFDVDTGEVLEKSCNISLDGVYCDSCSVATFEGTPQTNSLYFDTWNCTNIGLSASPTDGTFASRFLVDAPLLTGDPDCSKTDAPTVAETPTPTPAPPTAAAGTPEPSSAATTARGFAMPATAAAAFMVGVSLWSIATFGSNGM